MDLTEKNPVRKVPYLVLLGFLCLILLAYGYLVYSMSSIDVFQLSRQTAEVRRITTLTNIGGWISLGCLLFALLKYIHLQRSFFLVSTRWSLPFCLE